MNVDISYHMYLLITTLSQLLYQSTDQGGVDDNGQHDDT